MILKASQRGHAKELAHHLLNGDTNEHVTVHEIKGFVSKDIIGAFEEAHAVSLGTKCKQFLFSLSLNPPEIENPTIEDFEDAISKAEKNLGLEDQPRIIVFHEKLGRRHCHCVWSRIKTDTMTAINMAHFKRKLNKLAKSLYLKHGWDMPQGFKEDALTQPNPENYALPEWQQSERLRKSPEALRTFFKECWDASDDRRSFAAALQEYGFYLARGERRGYVAIDIEGEAYSLSRWAKIKNKELKAKLGDHETLPSAQDAQVFLEARLTDQVKQHMQAQKARAKEQRQPLVKELRDLVKQQRSERDQLLERQQKRWRNEHKRRQERLATGVRSIWERMTGQYQEIRTQNETEVKAAQLRDQNEMQALIQKHLEESREIHKTLKFYKQQEYQQQHQLQKQVAAFINTATEPPPTIEPIEEKLQEIEAKLTALSHDIADLQGALGQAVISDDIKAKIRILIERAKETFNKQQAEAREQERLETEQAEAEKLHQMQKQFYILLQEQERLKEEQRQREVNESFFKVISMMPQSLNGIPLYEIKLYIPPPINEHKYQQQLRRQPTKEIERATKPANVKRSDFDSNELRKSVLTVKEALARSKGGTAPPKGIFNKEQKIKFSAQLPNSRS